MYASGPNDDAAAIVAQLTRKVGAGAFDYLIGFPGDDLPFELDGDEDDEGDEGDEDVAGELEEPEER
jgi:hypothetical protein